MVVAEVNNNKNWLKPDQSKMKEKLTRERPIMKNDTRSRKGAKGMNAVYDPFRRTTLGTTSLPTRRWSQNLLPRSSEIIYPWKHTKSQGWTDPACNSFRSSPMSTCMHTFTFSQQCPMILAAREVTGHSTPDSDSRNPICLYLNKIISCSHSL